MNKDQVKSEVVKKLDVFCKERFEEIEFQTEGSLTDTYKYMSLSNVNDALEKCFEETYSSINNNDITLTWQELAKILDDVSWGLFQKYYGDDIPKYGYRELFPVISNKSELDNFINKFK